MVPATRATVWDRFSCPFHGFGDAALACAHFGEEAWDTVICGTKSTWAMFTHIISKASLQPSFDLNCASIFCRNQWKIVQKVVPNEIFLWLALWNLFWIVPGDSRSFPGAILVPQGRAWGALERPGEALRGFPRPPEEALGGLIFFRTPGPFLLLADLMDQARFLR